MEKDRREGIREREQKMITHTNKLELLELDTVKEHILRGYEPVSEAHKQTVWNWKKIEVVALRT